MQKYGTVNDSTLLFATIKRFNFGILSLTFMTSSTEMKALTKAMCWEVVSISRDKLNKVGIAVYKKPTSNECYEKRSKNEPSICQDYDDPNAAWYFFLY